MRPLANTAKMLVSTAAVFFVGFLIGYGVLAWNGANIDGDVLPTTSVDGGNPSGAENTEWTVTSYEGSRDNVLSVGETVAVEGPLRRFNLTLLDVTITKEYPVAEAGDPEVSVSRATAGGNYLFLKLAVTNTGSISATPPSLNVEPDLSNAVPLYPPGWMDAGWFSWKDTLPVNETRVGWVREILPGPAKRGDVKIDIRLINMRLEEHHLWRLQ